MLDIMYLLTDFNISSICKKLKGVGDFTEIFTPDLCYGK